MPSGATRALELLRLGPGQAAFAIDAASDPATWRRGDGRFEQLIE